MSWQWVGPSGFDQDDVTDKTSASPQDKIDALADLIDDEIASCEWWGQHRNLFLPRSQKSGDDADAANKPYLAVLEAAKAAIVAARESLRRPRETLEQKAARLMLESPSRP